MAVDDTRVVGRSLFDGRSLGQWQVTAFGGEGEVAIDNGAIILPFGHDLTGITWAGHIVPIHYEITLEAKRINGRDFFCGLTFPVHDQHCTLILGGWGGSLVGLSSIDGYDASENETTTYHTFEQNRWYRIRLRVSEGGVALGDPLAGAASHADDGGERRPAVRIEAWIDDERVIAVDVAGRRLSLRPEVEPSAPLGIATYRTTARLRNIWLYGLGE